jgi:hypothetical protein
VIAMTGFSDSHVRRAMKLGLPSKFIAGRRRFVMQDVLNWFDLPGADKPVKSFTPSRNAAA